jgi:hypothetical protein
MPSVSVAIVCETEGCPNAGQVINVVSEIPADQIDLFFEDYRGEDAEDTCSLCGQPGIAQDPVPEEG